MSRENFERAQAFTPERIKPKKDAFWSAVLTSRKAVTRSPYPPTVLEVVREATGGELADTVLDVSGNARAIALSVKLVKRLGTIVCAGTTSGGAPVTMSTNDLVNKEVRFQGAWSHSFESARQAIRLAETGAYPLEKVISHEFTLEEAEVAVRAMGREIEGLDPIKAAVKP